MNQIIVNVCGLSEKEKESVNEALAKVMGVTKLPDINSNAGWFLAPNSPRIMSVAWEHKYAIEKPIETHNPEEIIEMAKQGHPHSNLLMKYAEISKTDPEPCNHFEYYSSLLGEWLPMKSGDSLFKVDYQYRLKPKTHIVHGVEVPDLRFVPKDGEKYYLPDPIVFHLYLTTTYDAPEHYHRVSNNLCYEYTEEGKRAAILHAKAWLGTA